MSHPTRSIDARAAATLVFGALGLLAAACASGNEATTSGGGGGTETDASSDSAGSSGTAGTSSGGVGGSSAAGGSAGVGGSSAAGGLAGQGGDGGVAGQSGFAGSGGFAGAVDGGGDSDAAVPCEQIAEVCNGLDDNCNGTVDEGDPGGGAACTVPVVRGLCAEGITGCQLGLLDCFQVNTPSPEECNGLDDNCNGAVDEGNPDGGQQCPTGLLGICAVGTSKCATGALVCEQNLQPGNEVCNGLDDDCDGVPDEDFGGGSPCTVAGFPPGSPCAAGLTNCLSGQQGCTQVTLAAPETCDGIDNDCDGVLDNPAVLNGQSCNTGNMGVCAIGSTQCTAGTPSCVPSVTPGAQTETCNTLDDNCDGIVDNVPNISLECGAKNPLAQNVTGWGCTTGFCQVTSCSPGFSDCNGAPGDGCEINRNSNSAHCGGCGNVCNSTNGTPICAGGVCGIACNAGFGDCDGNPDNGCETNTNSSTSNCGTCGTTCTNPGGSTQCTGGNCQPVCNAGRANCDGIATNGCEVNTNTSTSNCGACNAACVNPNGTTSCVSGQCSPSCSSGFANCDGNDANGCETNLNTTTNHCGQCGRVCLNPNGTTSCVGGTCTPACSSGAANCDSNAVNGCETNTNTDRDNCGACSVSCTNSCGSTTCSFGTCAPTCGAGCASCDGNPVNGCETNLQSSLTNCGSCGTTCVNPNGSTTCTAGTCVPTCSGTFRNCDGNPINGCETDINSTVNHCSQCNKQCVNPNGSTTCVSGTCTPTCSGSFRSCDGNPDNGCETNTASDVNNCGNCGTVCTNPSGSVACVGGVCQPGCNPGRGDCDGNPANGCETDTTTTSNCGGCGVMCSNANGSTSCIGGSCVPSCSSGWGNCDGNPNNGCETSTNTTTNCGACARACSTAGVATASCSNGTCNSSCQSGFGNCVQPIAPGSDDGCETNTNNSTNNCGTCGTQCTNLNGSTQCIGGTCAPSCSTGWGNCDGNPNNGCETSITTTTNCGGCGLPCVNPNGTTTCNSSGACVPTCNPGFAVCSGDPRAGCTVNLNTSGTNCGTCGTNCSSPLPAQATAASCNGSGACRVDACQTNYYNMDNQYANGCECLADSVPNTCDLASTSPGTIGIGGAVTISNNLTPTGDTDWYRVTFTQSANCSYGPAISVTSGAVLIEVYTTCTGSTPGVPYTCGAGNSGASSSISSWSFGYSATCGNLMTIDPTPVNGTFIQWPATIWVRVKPAASASGCINYSILFDG